MIDGDGRAPVINDRTGVNAGEMSYADTLEEVVACDWALLIERSGKWVFLRYISSTRRLLLNQFFKADWRYLD